MNLGKLLLCFEFLAFIKYLNFTKLQAFKFYLAKYVYIYISFNLKALNIIESKH